MPNEDWEALLAEARRRADAAGFATRDALIEGYTDAGGRFDLERFEWWKVARVVWWALGLASQA